MNKLMKSRSVKRVAQGGLVAAALGVVTGTGALLPGTAGAVGYRVPNVAPIAATYDGIPGETQYLAAVDNPDAVNHNIYRYVNGIGSWQQQWASPGPLPTFAGSVSATADGNPGETQFTAVAGGVVYHDIRYSNGTWQPQGWLGVPTQPTGGNVQSVAAAYDGNRGETLYLANTLNGALYLNTRYANGNWQPQGWTQVSLPPGAAVSVAATADGNPHEIQFLADTTNGVVFHNILQVVNGNDIWQGWAEPSQPLGGNVAKVAATSDGNPDETQFLAVNTSGVVFHDIRFSNGTWQGWLQTPTQPPGGNVASVAAAYDGNTGETEFLTVNPSGVVYHNIRLANRNWLGWVGAPAQPEGTVVGW